MKKFSRTMVAIMSMVALMAGFTWADQHTVSTVYVIHGIPGTDLGLPNDLPVDVWVNDANAIPNFKFKQVVGPIEFDPGTYNIKIAPAGTTDPVIEADVPLFANETVVLIAHLTDEGGITASKFVFDVSPTTGHDARFSFIHAANAPVVDVTGEWLSGGIMPMFRVDEIQNGEKFQVDARAKSWIIKLWPTGVPTVAAKKKIKMKKQNLRLLFAVGSLENATFTFVGLNIKGLK
jgi:hypothetical protein